MITSTRYQIHALKQWLLLAIIVSFTAALVYVAVQQDLRQGANDPQIQMAEDGASSLDHGTDPKALVSNTTIDMTTSLAPYFIILDQNGKVIESSATLDGTTPVPPSGVLQYARDHQQNRLTWQPKPGVRQAIVVVPYSGGYVVAGRSLREVEVRENQLSQHVFATWIFTLLVTYIAIHVLKSKSES